MDDKTLSDRIRHGDRDAFGMLAGRYYGSLCAFAFRIVGSHESAEDIVQDTFVSCWIKRNMLSGADSARSYLYAAVRNNAVSYLRSEQRRNRNIGPTTAAEEDISRYFIEQETHRMLLESIDRLPPRTAGVIRSSLEGLRQEIIGEQMGITVATVKALKADGLKKLRKLLEATKAIFAL